MPRGSHQISSPLPPKSPKTPFWGTYQCKHITESALRKSPVNGAIESETLQLHCIGKYLGVRQSFSGSGRPGAQGPLM